MHDLICDVINHCSWNWYE